jgi:hypothetical protein
LIPAGLLVTVPVPSPDLETVNKGFRMNVAVTDLSPFIVTVHVRLMPLQAPVHPPNVEVAEFGAAVSITLVPCVYGSLQSVPQLIPEGLLVTVPWPLPDFETVRTGLLVNVAVTDLGPFIASVHVVVVPVHAPPHPANVAPEAGVAVSVTPVPTS